MSGAAEFPAYRDLTPADPVAGRHSWGVFGEQDELGRVNLLTAERVAAACREAVRGEVFNLSLPLHLPDPPYMQGRSVFRHEIFMLDRNGQDDRLDGFYLQASTQWDGLRHIRARELGFYGGRQAEQAGPDGSELGIEKWAEHGLVGRGVLVDVARHAAVAGRPLDPRAGTPITTEMLDEVLAAESAQLRTGDFLLLRTGYMAAYLRAGQDERDSFTVQRDCPGLYAGEEMAEYLWDHGVVGVVADNPTVEVAPGSREAGSLHRRLIPLLGFVFGEFFDFERLAADCAADGRYTCLFIGVPLNLAGGVGSPGNSIAIK
jgi:kynurenine formamidase